jgi:hypothetical protein
MSKWLNLLKAREYSATTGIEPTKPTEPPFVGFVGSIPRELEKNDLLISVDGQHDAYVSDWMDWQERSAIMEYDGGMTRAEAESAAAKVIRLDARRVK